MNFRRVHLIAGVALAGLALTLTGCSDSDTAADTKPAAANQPTSQQSTPTAPTSAPASAPASKPAEAPGGTDGGFCGVIENGAAVDIGKWSEPQSDPAVRAALTKRLNALVDVAPDELKQPLKDLASGYELVASGKVTENDQAAITKYSNAMLALNQYMVDNCKGMKLPTVAG
jgi:hypothetical protein